jgi:PAS domain S-box-containing protein
MPGIRRHTGTKSENIDIDTFDKDERFRYLAESSFEALFFSKKGICLDANQTAADMFGYTRKELIGIFGTDVIAPESKELVKKNMLGGITEPYEAVAMRKDGSRFHAQIMAKTLEYKGEQIRVTSLRDISDRKEIEERFRLAAEVASDLIYEWDVRTDKLTWYADIDAALGYEPGEIRHDIDSWVSRIHPDDLKRMENSIEHHRTCTNPIFDEYRIRNKKGEWFYWTDKGTPVLGTDGLPSKWIGVCTDITVQKQLERQFLQSQKMEAIGTLAGGMAHEINNVLAVIMGLASTLKEEIPADSSQYLDLQAILSATRRGSGITHSLLGFARKSKHHEENVQLNNVINELERLLLSTLSKKIGFELILDEDLAGVRGDKSQLTQVLMNLCLNAADAINEEGLLTITTANIEMGEKDIAHFSDLPCGQYVKICVVDNGSGMDSDTVSHAFEPFYTTKDIGKGSGLGLSMVYGAVKDHGGGVRIDSQLGEGTTITVVLPASKTIADEKRTDLLHEKPVTGTGTILVVDDERMVRMMSKRLLERLGYRVILAEDGRAALNTYRQRQQDIDLVLLDASMPVMDGAECLRELNEINPDVKVVICSGDVSSSEAKEAVDSGALGLLEKPYDIQRLSDMVAFVLIKPDSIF